MRGSSIRHLWPYLRGRWHWWLGCFVYALIGAQIRERRVPSAQLALMWVSTNIPTATERILALARAHYVGEPARSATL